MSRKSTALTLVALMLVGLTACTTQPQVMTLSTIGAPNRTPIATMDDAQSTQSLGPTHTPGGTETKRGFVCTATEADDREGEPFLEGAPERAKIAPDGAGGDKLILTGTVYVITESGCQPLEDAVIDVWQADANGHYDVSQDFLYRGKVKTDAQGHYKIETIIPGEDESFPKHIHLRITHPNSATLTTQVYFEGDDLLSGATANDSPRILPLTQSGDVYSSSFDIVLTGK